MLNMQGRVLTMDSCACWDVYVRRDSPQRLSSKEVTLRYEFQVRTIMAKTLLIICISVFQLISVFILIAVYASLLYAAVDRQLCQAIVLDACLHLRGV